MTRTSVCSKVGSLLGLALLTTACGDLDPETTHENGALVGGSGTTARPEVGHLASGCTGTLIDKQYFISASHCFGYTSGSKSNAFEITRTDGTRVPNVKIDYAYAVGTEVGEYDFGFGRLALDVPASDAVPSFIGGNTTPNEQVSAFGYGYESRSPQTNGGVKRYINYTFGQHTQMGARGDSGGPRFHGFDTGNGGIWGIFSGAHDIDDPGENDILANAWLYAPTYFRAVKKVGGTSVTEKAAPSTFGSLAREAGVKAVSGDFNADGRADIALVGGATWTTVPVALGDGFGGFTFTNGTLTNFATWARAARHFVAADFDRDGDTDLALLGGPWNFIPIAWSNRNGTFTAPTPPPANNEFPSWTQQAKVTALTGDFNADGFGDIAVVGGTGWQSVPVGFSNGNGLFTQTNFQVQNFPGWAQATGARPYVGDFDGDGDADIALTGVLGWNSIPVAFSDRSGRFPTVTNTPVSEFPGWTAFPAPKVVVGDFDADGDADLAAVGGAGWRSFTFAFSNRAGGFDPGNFPHPSFAQMASAARFAFGARANGDGTWDLILAGGSAQTIPVAIVKPSANTLVSQSSDPFGAPAKLAYDGNPDGEWGHGSVTHTDFEFQPYWQADMLNTPFVTSVDVYNRVEVPERLTNFNVSVSRDGFNWTTVNVPGQGQRPTTVTFNTHARLVKIQLQGTNYLSLAEVDIKTQ